MTQSATLSLYYFQLELTITLGKQDILISLRMKLNHGMISIIISKIGKYSIKIALIDEVLEVKNRKEMNFCSDYYDLVGIYSESIDATHNDTFYLTNEGWSIQNNQIL